VPRRHRPVKQTAAAKSSQYEQITTLAKFSIDNGCKKVLPIFSLVASDFRPNRLSL
jgi:hypothetical protein